MDSPRHGTPRPPTSGRPAAQPARARHAARRPV